MKRSRVPVEILRRLRASCDARSCYGLTPIVFTLPDTKTGRWPLWSEEITNKCDVCGLVHHGFGAAAACREFLQHREEQEAKFRDRYRDWFDVKPF